MNSSQRKEIFARFKSANPHPTTELEYASPFELMIAVILSAQATDKSVNVATRNLFPLANTPEKMLALGEAGLREIIKSIGLYKTKAKNILATCQLLIHRYGSKVPQTRDELEQLPGVGRKTANVILNTAFGEPTIAVDTHIFRVANRTGIAPGKTVLEVELKLIKNVPPSFRHDAHHWLILHGRYICVARKPKCAICMINDLCEYKEKNFEKTDSNYRGAPVMAHEAAYEVPEQSPTRTSSGK
jgi:endonuclease III